MYYTVSTVSSPIARYSLALMMAFMWDAIAAEIWTLFKSQWGAMIAAPIPFLIALALTTLIVGLVLAKYYEGKSRDEHAIMAATIEHQRELLSSHREREENAKEKIAELTRTLEFRLLLLAGNVFVPESEPGWTGFNISAKLWNTRAESVSVSWSFTIIPNGQLPVLAQWTNRPEQIRASGPKNSSVMRASEGLDNKTSHHPVGSTPVSGEILFYTTLSREIVTDQDTWIELSVMDIFQSETVAKKRMGDWLRR